uniref:Calmodulin n=1 Tax=Octactis speculum TaxID=3111310 RepID=A0A7S2CHR9_9STRA|mmetsp:Transcript_36039/g.48744  ORF Transcript_36039/g.48744 Transcript_36039/m.48744 type:complete len:567 (+) Transcript_36039:81-1781(+)
MGGGSSTDRRYMSGMLPEDYWEKVAWPENKEVLSILQLNKHQALKIFEAFVDIDSDNSGEMSVEEFHVYLGMTSTKFSERIFGILDADASGALNFSEFAVGVWNYCTYDVRLITKLAFDIFDIDQQGKLDLAECDALLRMVYDVPHLDNIEGPPSGKEIMELIDVNGDGEVTIDEFSDLMETHLYILQPALDLQRALRQRLLGVKFWDGLTELRRQLFAAEDSLASNSIESMKEILVIKQKERESRQHQEEEALSEEEQAHILEQKERARRKHAEKQYQKKRRVQKLNAQITEEEKAEKLALAEVRECRLMLEEPFTFDQLSERRQAREALYSAANKLKDASLAALNVRQANERKNSIEVDRSVDLFLQSKAGRNRLAFEVQLAYGREMAEWCERGNSLRAVFTPFFTPTEGGTASTATGLVKRFTRAKNLSAARQGAHSAILNEFMAEHKTKLSETHASERANQQTFTEALFVELVAVFFGPDTEWEKLWDPDSSAPYWYHIPSGRTEWLRPAICHNCDAFIDPMDARCFECDTDRTAANVELYTGLSAEALRLKHKGNEDEDSD